MEFNPDITKQATELIFSCKKASPLHPPLIFNDTDVRKVDEHKHLGLVLDSRLSFRKHLTEKIKMAKMNLGIIKNLSKFLPRKTLDQMYKTLVRSHLDYCDVIYHTPSYQTQPFFGLSLHSLMNEVERIQYQAALAISGTWQGSCRNKLYEELGWESLSDRRFSRRLLLIHKIINNQTPSYLKDKLLPFRRPLYSRTNENTLREYRCKSSRYMNSFFPHATASWNVFIAHFEEIHLLKNPIFGSFQKTY